MNRRMTWLVIAFLAGLLLAAHGKAQEPQSERLQVRLPRPRFIGTPKDLRTPNLEPPRKEAVRPPFYVPAGCSNVALHKPVTASDNAPVIGENDQVTDGDKEGQEGCYVEFGPGTQWTQIDLGREHAIYAILIWHFHCDPRVYRDVIVRVSNDPAFIADVQTVFNNDHDNSSGLGIGRDYEYIETYEGRLIDAKGAKGRYVRLYSRGNTSNELNHYTEVEVYGKSSASSQRRTSF